MANIMQPLSSVTHQDFMRPHPRSLIIKPSPPPINLDRLYYLPRPDLDDCRCNEHGFQSDKNRYMQLADKERRLHDELIKVNREMAKVTSTILESTCETGEDILKSVYETDYEKRGLPIGRYRRMKVALDSPIGSPIAPVVKDLRNGYRDPTRFRYSAIERPRIQPAKSVVSDTVPEIFSFWNEPFTGQSEYMDRISKLGLSNMKNQQQYLEPIPSTRRRYPDYSL